jgi:CysZ protein
MMDNSLVSRGKGQASRLAHPPDPGKVSLWAGPRAFFGGLVFVVTTPSVWLPAMVPMGIALVLLGTVTGLGIWGAVHVVKRSESAWGTAGGVALGLVAPLVAVAVAAALSQPLSGPALDSITRRQERAMGAPGHPEVPLLASVWRSLRVNLLGLGVGLPLLGVLSLITLIAPPAGAVTVPLNFLVTALMLAWDFLDYPLGMRGLGIRARLSWIGRNFLAVLAFGSLCAAVLLVPAIGLVVLPFGVAGASRLAVMVDRGGRSDSI